MDSSISSVKIGTRGEEYAAMHILEVTSIPDVASVLSERRSADENDVIAAYRDGMAVMLSEAHQRWKAWGSGSRDVSVELMWLTRSVANQPYAASIRLFLVSRALATDRAAAAEPSAPASPEYLPPVGQRVEGTQPLPPVGQKAPDEDSKIQ